ncbi:SRPBCC family protein [Sinomonas sp. ASV486]|uniref:SRPBCC family protein n=1 Tax=Sinomonas sp. ASV486 TaxID=3051170 RepID=UPI0027DD180B|nr:SRPBCC family protein [Sinomonas sp. ASV486]MDQ4489156.1 SRPBCC family protein [Sinomonas sp. ASV486]
MAERLAGRRVDVEVATTIARPCAVVAAYAADPDNAPEWYANIRSAVWRTPKPLAVGSEIDFRARFMGRDLAYTYRVEEFVPGERLVMATAQGPFPMRTTYTWAVDHSGSTVMTLRNDGAPRGFAALTAPLMEAMMRRANVKDLARIKDILEARG